MNYSSEEKLFFINSRCIIDFCMMGISVHGIESFLFVTLTVLWNECVCRKTQSRQIICEKTDWQSFGNLISWFRELFQKLNCCTYLCNCNIRCTEDTSISRGNRICSNENFVVFYLTPSNFAYVIKYYLQTH